MKYARQSEFRSAGAGFLVRVSSFGLPSTFAGLAEQSTLPRQVSTLADGVDSIEPRTMASLDVMTSSSNSSDQKLSRGALIALVVGSMVGSGIFACRQRSAAPLEASAH